MRVALVVYMDLTGPGPIHAYNFAQELVNQGLEPMLLVYGDPTTTNLMAQPPRFPVAGIEFTGGFLAQQTLEALTRHQPELVHIWTPRNVPVRVGLECVYRFNSKLVIHFEDAEEYLLKFHGAEAIDSFPEFFKRFHDPGFWSWKLPFLSAFATRYAAAFTVISKSLYRQIDREWGKQTLLLYPGIDLTSFKPDLNPDSRLKKDAAKNRILLYSGSIGSMHEFDSLLEAVALVKSKHPDIRFVHLGRNLIQQETDAVVARLGLTETVQFLGPIAHKEIPRYLAAADVLLQAGSPGEFNRYRLPSKLPEYLAMGRPIITFSEGFGEELTDGYDVLKTYTGSPEELAQCLDRILTDAKLAQRLSINSRRKAEVLFDWRANTEKLAALYRDVAQTARPLYVVDSQRIPVESDKLLTGRLRPPRIQPAPARRVLVVTPEMLPLPGQISSGAGLRAYSIGETLREQGFEVVYSLPTTALPSAGQVPQEIVQYAYVPPDCAGVINRVNPDAVVFCHWPVLADCQEDPPVPVALDLAGPHLLERLYIPGIDLDRSMVDKLRALNRADFISCAGQRQQAYFIPWLMAAGKDPQRHEIAVIPISMPAECPLKNEDNQVRFVFSGIFLPWQNPGSILEQVVACLEQHPPARLAFFGGPHPVHNLSAGLFEHLERRLKASAVVDYSGLVPFSELIKQCQRCTAAIDLLLPNVERRIAFNVRTIVYLWCGVPVIYNDYAEIAELIRAFDAGWLVNPADHKALIKTMETIMSAPEQAKTKGLNAQRLVAKLLNQHDTMKPLVEFLRQPRFAASVVWEPFARETCAKLSLLVSSLHQATASDATAAESLDGAARLEIQRLQMELHQRETELRLTRDHARNLEQFRAKIMNLPPYKVWKALKNFASR